MDVSEQALDAPVAEEEEADVGPPLPPAEGDGQDGEDGQGADVGPAPPKPKRRKTLEFEQQYLQSLPLADMYEKSYMHRDTVVQVAVSHGPDFIITASVDGHIKFWKKQPQGIEFAKHFKAHLGPVTGLAVSNDGSLCASISSDKSVKVFDVASFDMIAMLRLPFVPGVVEWVFKRGDAKTKLAVSDQDSPNIHIYDMKAGSNEPIDKVTLHTQPVTAMRYIEQHHTVVSTDKKGVIEYWSASSYGFPAEEVSFQYKLDTDLYALAKAKAVVHSLEVARDGSKFVTMSSDRKVRVFRFATGKLSRAYDESLEATNELQRSDSELCRLDPIDFGRRLAVEKEMAADPLAPPPSAAFDDSGNFLLYPTLVGIKVVNLVTNKVVKIIGKVESGERFLRLALYQGVPRRSKKLPVAPDSKLPQPDPTLVCCAYRKQRLYLFTQREPQETDDATQARDVFNERPVVEEGAQALQLGGGAAGAGGELPHGAIIRTSRGDIWVKLFSDDCPRTVENFTTHAKNGYYDGVIFHRVIKGFMLQTGDPLGDGTGGESIWGGEFEDEIRKNLRHDRPFTLSMANAGPNTNGSQFFLTTVPCPWLDGKHTVFGRVVKGMDVVLAIEKVKTNSKNDKPLEDIKILNIEPKASVE
ncbi:hypothetical protein N2152v2_001769 [Parachlorella kessleri]